MFNQLLPMLIQLDGVNTYPMECGFCEVVKFYGVPIFILGIISLLLLIIYKKRIIKDTGISKIKYILFIIYNTISIIIPILFMFLVFYSINIGINDSFEYIKFYYYPDPILIVIFVYLYLKYKKNVKKLEIKK